LFLEDPLVSRATATLTFEAIMKPYDPEATVDGAGATFDSGARFVCIVVQGA
jgi:hypothetical protein